MASTAAAIAFPQPPITAAEEPKPSFEPVVEKNSRQYTTCGMSCWARSSLLGSSGQMTIAVRQTGPEAELTPVSPEVVLQGQQSGDLTVLGGSDVDFTAAEDATTQDHFTVDLSGLDDPDEYTGALLFATTGNAEQVSVPVTIKVREGPLLPLIVLALTVALGAAMGWLLDRRPAAKFRHEAKSLQAKIGALPKSERSVLLPLWEKMWEGRGSDLTTAEKRLGALERGAEALRECRDAQDEALRSPMALKLAPWLQRIGNATDRLVAAVRSFSESYDDKVALVVQTKEDFADAVEAKEEVGALGARAASASSTGAPYRAFKAAAEKLEGAIDGVSPDATQAAPDLKPLRANLKSEFRVLEEAKGEPLEEIEAGIAPAGLGAARMAAMATLGWPAPPSNEAAAKAGGLSIFDAKAFLGASIGPVAAVGVMLVLLAIGLKVTYLDNATFGATFTDWLTLAFWGFAAYGARKTLTGLGPSSGGAASS